MNSEIVLRLASLDDYSTIYLIETTCFKPAHQSTRRSLHQSLHSKRQQVWLADIRQNDLVMKPTAAMILWLYPKTLRIFSIAVLPEFQQHGIGAVLLDKAKAIASENHIERIVLEVEKDNVMLVKWYQKHGFVVDKILVDYYSEDSHGLKMSYNVNAESAQ